MSFVSTVYKSIFRRTSTFALTCVAGAFVFERAFDLGATSMFESMNEGVSLSRNSRKSQRSHQTVNELDYCVSFQKLWKHVKGKYCEEE